MFYALSEFKDNAEKLRYLQSVTEPALACLEHHVDDAMDLIAEILENYPKFFELKQQELIWSVITGSWGMEILKNLDAETAMLARIIVAYAQIPLNSKDLILEPNSVRNQQVMGTHSSPLTRRHVS